MFLPFRALVCGSLHILCLSLTRLDHSCCNIKYCPVKRRRTYRYSNCRKCATRSKVRILPVTREFRQIERAGDGWLGSVCYRVVGAGMTPFEAAAEIQFQTVSSTSTFLLTHSCLITFFTSVEPKGYRFLQQSANSPSPQNNNNTKIHT